MERRRQGEDTWRAMEALQVMSLLLKVQVFVLLKVADVFSLLSPLTRTQTTMPHTERERERGQMKCIPCILHCLADPPSAELRGLHS